MNDANSIRARVALLPVKRAWSRLRARCRPAPAVLLVALMLAAAPNVRGGAAVARSAAPPAGAPALLQQSQPVNYHLHGEASFTFDYSSPAGLQALSQCNVSVAPKWRVVLDGTLDSVGQNLKGTFQPSVTPDVFADAGEWDSALLQCGPEMNGQTSCNAGCGPFWITYNYVAQTGAIGTGQFGTFTGTYDSSGNITILGHTFFSVFYLLLDCANMDTGTSTPCDQAFGYQGGPAPSSLRGVPRNAKFAAAMLGDHGVEIDGALTWSDDFSGLSIRGNMKLPDSAWSDCCIVSDPLFLSDKNHVSITGEPAPPAH